MSHSDPSYFRSHMLGQLYYGTMLSPNTEEFPLLSPKRWFTTISILFRHSMSQKQPLFLHSNSFLSSYRLAILGMSLKIILRKFIDLDNNSYEHKYPGMSQASFGAHPLVIKYLPFTISTFSWCLQAFLSLTKHKTQITKQSFLDDSFIALRRLNANFVAQISWSLYSDIWYWTPRSL